MRSFVNIEYSCTKGSLAHRCKSNAIYARRSICFVICFIVFSGLTLSGCARYSVSVNDRPVYTPPEILEESFIQDTALSTCVQQTIEDQRVRQLTDLTWLDCDYAGISTLQGLSKYSRIEQLSLRHNRITNVDELLRLTHLVKVDLSENPNLTCDDFSALRSAGIETINSHTQCN